MSSRGLPLENNVHNGKEKPVKRNRDDDGGFTGADASKIWSTKPRYSPVAKTKPSSVRKRLKSSLTGKWRSDGKETLVTGSEEKFNVSAHEVGRDVLKPSERYSGIA